MPLVLSRRIGEAIQITDDIKVVVTEVRGNRARLSIEAPKEMAIWRVDANGQSESAAPPAKDE